MWGKALTQESGWIESLLSSLLRYCVYCVMPQLFLSKECGVSSESRGVVSGNLIDSVFTTVRIDSGTLSLKPIPLPALPFWFSIKGLSWVVLSVPPNEIIFPCSKPTSTPELPICVGGTYLCLRPTYPWNRFPSATNATSSSLFLPIQQPSDWSPHPEPVSSNPLWTLLPNGSQYSKVLAPWPAISRPPWANPKPLFLLDLPLLPMEPLIRQFIWSADLCWDNPNFPPVRYSGYFLCLERPVVDITKPSRSHWHFISIIVFIMKFQWT